MAAMAAEAMVGGRQEVAEEAVMLEVALLVEGQQEVGVEAVVLEVAFGKVWTRSHR